MAAKKSNAIFGYAENEVTLRDKNNVFSKSRIWVERQNFYGPDKPRQRSEKYLIVGFDTEFKTPDVDPTRQEVKEGLGKYKVISYQFHCILYDPDQPDAQEWSGICYPNGRVQNDDGVEVEGRLTLIELLTYSIWKGITEGIVSKIPLTIYLVGHFTRADVPAFADFKSLSEVFSSVRSTFISIDGHMSINIAIPDDGTVTLKLFLRDTYLLTPATSKSLKALGELVGVEKLQISSDPKVEQKYKENMDQLLADDPGLFERYAINDAVICAKYLDLIIVQCLEVLGKRKVPATLTGIGVSLLLNVWKATYGSHLPLIGKEEVSVRRYNKRLGYYRLETEEVYLEEVSLYVPLATESYHGGRNEQFWFGPAFEDDWTDYDLAGAYPTAMALLGKPDWRKIHATTRLSDFTLTTLGMANVEFEFPKSVRFPTLPVRTENGLVFPRKGISNCAAPEVALAVSLGAKVRIRHGVVIPTDGTDLMFGPFISQCIQKRLSYPKGSLNALFWKELSNSSYGKTAQGLHLKRVYDSRDRTMMRLPESAITNAFFAAYITSFVRAALGEIVNRLPPEVCVFSCTTDGFLTNAKEGHIEAASDGPIAALYRQSRKTLTGDPTMLEVKHRVRKPLGWRTRGQATLIEGVSNKGDDHNIVLAKGGIYTPSGLDDVRSRNTWITGRFFNRKPDDQIEMKIKTGIREIVEYDADFVDKATSKRLNMEYDWKCRPVSVSNDPATGHLYFSTEPWDTIDQFAKMRGYWERFGIENPRCLKSTCDYHQFAVYVLAQSSLDKEGSKFLRKSNPDLNRLRQMLCAAWRKSCAGLTWKVTANTAQEFAEVLSSVGIPCKRSDVENARKPFIPAMCPSTPAVFLALDKLKAIYPTLEIETLLTSGEGIDLIAAQDRVCEFLPLSSTSLEA